MPIPTYDKIMYPILELASKGEQELNGAVREISNHFKLTDSEENN